MTLALEPTPKIIDEVRKRLPKIYLVAFKAETSGSPEELKRAIKKFKDKVGANLVVGNDASEGKAFGRDNNDVVIQGDRKTRTSGEQSKEKIAKIVFDEIVADQRPRKPRRVYPRTDQPPRNLGKEDTRSR
jgi:phosphopantothenoylcysteine decarboxylase / phosphopantothenate---cysteine ligase